jgi:hypothetical protein
MTSPVALIALIFDGVDLQPADHQWFFEIERGLDDVPTVRGKDTVIPGAEGRFEQNRKIDTLSIVLKADVTADPALTDVDDIRASYRENMSTIRALFAPDRARALLEVLLEDGSTRTISARPINILPGLYIGSEYRTLNIELEGSGDWEVGS